MGGGLAFTDQKIDLSAATAVVQGDAWPTPIAWVDGTDGVATKVGGSLCASVPTDQGRNHFRYERADDW